MRMKQALPLVYAILILCGSFTACLAQPLAPQSPDDVLLQNTVYTARDSAEVCRLLRLQPTGNDVLFYGRQFKGIPYVAHTLEVADPERLVVNLTGLDCTTFVETACALAMTHRQGSTSFADYCRNLMRLRYRGGVMDGYLSRLHYFTWWLHDNVDKGLFTEVRDNKHWNAPLTVRNHYMTKHWEQYKMLKANPEFVPEITRMEREANGPDGTYLPESALSLGKDQLACIHDGDVIGIVTTKDGLDYSHLGIAVWGRDGKLHLLNASSVYKKVVEDNNTLHKYLGERKTSTGIRLLRLK